MMRKRLLIADDHLLMVEGIRSLLEPGYDIVGVAADGRELVALALELRPDLILLDIAMPILNGIEAMRKIRAAWPDSLFLVVTQQVDRAYLLAALGAGARGYIVKQGAARELRTAIADVLDGRYYVTASMTHSGETIADLAAVRQTLAGSGLTARQREVLQLVAEGKSAKEIAFILCISPKTVEFHKASLMNELGLHSTAELTRFAIAHGIAMP